MRCTARARGVRYTVADQSGSLAGVNLPLYAGIVLRFCGVSRRKRVRALIGFLK